MRRSAARGCSRSRSSRPSPDDAHIRQASPRTSGVTILRRGYDTPHGLLFLAFMKDPRRQFVPLQQRLQHTTRCTRTPRSRGSAVFAIPRQPVVVRSMIVSLHVTHFSDPGCPWAWSASPAIAALKWRYGDQLEWRDVMIGLTENGSVYEERGYTPAGQARGYRNFRWRGMPFATEPRERVHGTWPMCRVVVATRRLAPEREYAVFRALQFAQFTSTLFLEDHGTARGDRVGARHRRRRDHRRRARPGDRGAVRSRTATRPARPPAARPSSRTSTPTPTAACATPRRASASTTARPTLEAGGFQSFEAYDVLIANLDQSLDPPRARRGRRRGPRSLPGRPDDRRGRADHGRGQVPARPRHQAEDALITAIGDGAARLPFGHDALWVPERAAAQLAAAA